MKIYYFNPLWGSESLDFKIFVEKSKVSGYDGIEMVFPLNKVERDAKWHLIKENGLKIIAQHAETFNPDFKEHKKEFIQRLYNLTDIEPLFINSQTGKDYFSYDQNAELISIANDISKETGVKILHETHRGKFSFAAHIMKPFLENIGYLNISADFSHWCAVAESDNLSDQPEALQLAMDRAHHLHARIGFAEGPQIPDPRTKEWEQQVTTYTGWWEKIIKKKKEEGWKEYTITPEFGPFPYMQIMPFTKIPITNQWEVNVFMKDLLKDKFRHI